MPLNADHPPLADIPLPKMPLQAAPTLPTKTKTHTFEFPQVPSSFLTPLPELEPQPLLLRGKSSDSLEPLGFGQPLFPDSQNGWGCGGMEITMMAADRQVGWGDAGMGMPMVATMAADSNIPVAAASAVEVDTPTELPPPPVPASSVLQLSAEQQARFEATMEKQAGFDRSVALSSLLHFL